jgi:precorrin-6A/cobalt-precorrin-6A reductase
MILILGGTTEAMALARRIAARGEIDALLSLAGRTVSPVLPPVPHRIGGFGGVEGLAAFLREARIRAVIDATHPFAARMKANAAAACEAAHVPLLALTRPAWVRQPGDHWTEVETAEAAAQALGAAPRRVFLTAGRLEIPAFLAMPQHVYLIRTIDPPEAMPPNATLLLDRGPFDAGAEEVLMRREGIEILVTKNSGGAATEGKILAARALGLPVILIARPETPSGVAATGDVEAAYAFALTHGAHAPSGTDRGV